MKSVVCSLCIFLVGIALFALTLPALGQEVTASIVGTVTDGRMLLEEFSRLHPDVVLLDVAMPLLNGLDAGRQLKAQQKSVKLIYPTMNPNPELAGEALRLGAADSCGKRS